jgi:hypothetical protein
VQLVVTCLLYFTSFGAIFALFASVVATVIWLFKTIGWWLIAEPEADLGGPRRFRPQELEHLKRAGQ